MYLNMREVNKRIDTTYLTKAALASNSFPVNAQFLHANLRFDTDQDFCSSTGIPTHLK
jgi:argininosuccinate lyase